MADERGPELPLDVGERVVGRLHRWWRRRRARAQALDPTVVARLDALEAHLRIVAQLVAGRAAPVRTAEGSGGVRPGLILLPATMMVGPSTAANTELYTLRAAIDGTRLQLGVAPSSGDPLRDELVCLAEAAAALRWLSADFTGFPRRLATARAWIEGSRPADLSPRARALEALRLRVLAGGPVGDVEALHAQLAALDGRGPDSPPIPLWGGALAPTDAALADTIEAEEAAARVPITTELDAPPKDAIERAFLDPADDDAEVMPVHTFEKVECLDDFNGNMRRVDGSDELEDHLDALDEVDLRHVIRGGEAAESVFRAELEGLSTIPDVSQVAPSDTAVRYDEWHRASGRYRRGWVTVYPSVARSGDQAWARERLVALSGLQRDLLRRLEGDRDARAWVGRQRDGDEVDLDALIESYGDRRAGRPDDQRVFRRNPRRRRDTATTVLIDVSLSADSWVDNRRVLDVSRDAILLLGEVADALGDRLQVLAFASNTRNHCRVWQVKGWREPWSTGRARLGALTPTGYTRIGPALRHATALLDREPAERKLLLLVTDGKPNDYDRYEGAHGIADVRQATREAAQAGICVHAIGIDPSAAKALPVMFGVGGSQVLRALSALPEALVEAYGRAT